MVPYRGAQQIRVPLGGPRDFLIKQISVFLVTIIINKLEVKGEQLYGFMEKS